MYKIIAVSRCEIRALKETRKILDTFGKRISDKSWEMLITKEGLQFLINKLRKTARKNTAVAIYSLKENRMRLYTIIGNRKEFGNDGACPVSTTKRMHNSFKDQTDYQEMPNYQKIMEFIGYCHDLGKISGLFQEKLKGKSIKDIFRHEFFTILLLLYPNIEDLKTKIINIVETKKFIINEENAKNKILVFCCKVIASHHKLSTADNQYTLNFNNLIVKEEIVISKKELDKLFKYLNNAEFKKILQTKELLFNKIKDFEIKLNLSHFFYFRNALMLADHFCSSKIYDKPVSEDELLAKSKEYGLMPLNSHLYSVSKMSRYIIDDFTQYKNNNKFLYLATNELENVLKPSRTPFLWQNNSNKEMLKISQNNDNSNLIILGAKTGAGKTRMALRLMIELNKEKELRLNVLLGLRTLTTQTAVNYRKMLNVHDDMLALIVGESDLMLKDNQEGANEDNDNFDNEDNFLLENGTIDNRLSKYILHGAKTEKKQKLISTPIVISTIDYLIKSADWRKSKHLFPQLRLMSSDLIIDEVDMYDEKQLLHILKLVYLAGLFGRNVIVTTATISPVLAEEIKKYFYKGNKDYNSYRGVNNNQINVHYLSDIYNKSDILKDENYPFFEKNMVEASKNIVDKIHKVKVVKNSGLTNDILNYILQLHQNNVCKTNNFNYSVGLLRVQEVRQGFNLLKFLLDDDNLSFFEEREIKVNFVFYHARLLLAVRKKIELELDKALYRNSKKDNFLSSNIFKDNFKNGYKDYITIVIASPVEEVGRDHDFDWGLIEPLNSRSIIQSIGRINRHRQKEITEPNAFVFDKMFKNINNKKRKNQKDFSIFEQDCSAKNIFSPAINSQPYKENEVLKRVFSNTFIFNTTDDFPMSQDVITDNFRNENEQIEYRFDLEDFCFKQLDEYGQLVDTNIKTDFIANESYSFINDKSFISLLEDYDINDTKILKAMHYKSTKDIICSKSFGII